MKKYLTENYVSKKRIRKKIEELKSLLAKYDKYENLNIIDRYNVNIIDAKIEVLEHLLITSVEV